MEKDAEDMREELNFIKGTLALNFTVILGREELCPDNLKVCTYDEASAMSPSQLTLKVIEAYMEALQNKSES